MDTKLKNKQNKLMVKISHYRASSGREQSG